MNASPPVRPQTETPGFPGISFGTSADGMPVARVGDTAFAMAKARDDRHYLVTAWRLARPMGEWTREDFYGHSGELADEAAFRARVLENAEHQRERKALRRVEGHSRAHTPWGASQGATVYAEGVASHTTAGHGGFKLSAERNRKVHPMLRSASGWYEKDAAWAIVAITFPHLFTVFERRCAERTIKDSWPDAWEAIFGTVLRLGESREKDRCAFEREHAGDWIVVSAITSKREKGFVEVVATRGGKRSFGIEERRFLVPADEYEMRRFGFVIDEARHPIYDGIELRGPTGKGAIMIPFPERCAQLSRMHEARRQIQRQLDQIDRQITRRMTALIPQLKQNRTCYRRGKPPNPSAFLERYHSNLASITAERQPEIDALSRKLARQDAAIAAFCQRHGLTQGSPDSIAAARKTARDRASVMAPSRSQKVYDHG